jgi:hypothetical protein
MSKTGILTTEWDWTIGGMIQILIFILWAINVIYGFITLYPWFAGMAIVTCIWFLVAPWCVSEYPRALDIHNLAGLSSIYGKIHHDYFMAKYS